MPSKSAPQARFMAAAAHNPGFAAKAGIGQDTAREFNQADKGKGKIKPKKKVKSKGKKAKMQGKGKRPAFGRY